jgi:hypothetical protein
MEGKRQINLKLKENGTHRDMKKKLYGRMQSVCLYVFYSFQIYISAKLNENGAEKIDVLIPVAKLPWRLGFAWRQWRTEGGLGVSNPPTRNPEVLKKLSRIPSSVKNTSVTT